MNRYECLMFALQLFFIQYILSMCQIECTLTLLDIHTIVIIAQLERFMPGVCDGSKIGGMCMSEPNAGERIWFEYPACRITLRGIHCTHPTTLPIVT